MVVLIYLFISPSIQFVVFFLASGGDLKDVRVAYSNNDVFMDNQLNLSTLCNGTPNFNRHLNLGQLYMSILEDDETFKLVRNGLNYGLV